VVAELFLTLAAVQGTVGLFGKPLGVTADGDLPPDQQGQGAGQEAPGVPGGDKDQRGSHHGVVPVINAAGGAALVLHEPGLEGAEEEDADHVAHGVGQAHQQEDACVDDPGEIQAADGPVQGGPGQDDGQGGLPGLQVHPLRRLVPGLVVFPELLLTAHTLQGGGEEPQDHLHDQDQPHHPQKGMDGPDIPEELFRVPDQVGGIDQAGPQEEQGTKDQLSIVLGGYFGQLTAFHLNHGRTSFVRF